MEQKQYQQIIKVLNQELVPALGCTEPIAIAYAAAKAREILGEMPEHIMARCSGNIIKNVKGVIVPSTGNMRGIETSAILGALAGDADARLEVLEKVTKQDVEQTRELLERGMCEIALIPGGANLQIIIEADAGEDHAEVEIRDQHTNIVRMEKNGQILFEKTEGGKMAEAAPALNLPLQEIYDFANQVRIQDVKEVLDRQIQYNTDIAAEGLANSYGANVGKTILKNYGNDVKNLAKAFPAAGSDARMGGCMKPVVINSGSGNQGMTVSLPVIVYAKYLKVSQETLYRALVLSNLVAIHLKSGIGKLSAYCGAVSAACGSGAAITYLHGAPLEVIEKTITNTIGNISGMVCDGAKSSCAAKIASAVDAAVMGHYMAMDNNTFGPGEGLVKDDVEKTIETVSTMGREGMKQTDQEILELMIH